MIVIFFGSDECEKCQAFLTAIIASGLVANHDFHYIDAYDFKNQEIQQLCDKFDVDEIPHIVVYSDDEELKYNEVGPETLAGLYDVLRQKEDDDTTQQTTGRSS